MNALEELGYRLRLGQTGVYSMRTVREALAASHRHQQKHEIDLGDVVRTVEQRRMRAWPDRRS